MKEIVLLPRSAWRTIELDVPTRKFKTPRVFDQKVPWPAAPSANCSFRIWATMNPRSCSPTNSAYPPRS